LSLVLCAAIFHVGFSAEPEWKRALGQVAIAALWFGASAALIKMFVRPWHTLKQSGAITAAKASDNAS
jgi:hypothetical protein